MTRVPTLAPADVIGWAIANGSQLQVLAADVGSLLAVQGGFFDPTALNARVREALKIVVDVTALDPQQESQDLCVLAKAILTDDALLTALVDAVVDVQSRSTGGDGHAEIQAVRAKFEAGSINWSSLIGNLVPLVIQIIQQVIAAAKPAGS